MLLRSKQAEAPPDGGSSQVAQQVAIGHRPSEPWEPFRISSEPLVMVVMPLDKQTQVL